MKTECTQPVLSIKRLGKRNVVADFNGGQITSDGGALLLADTDRRLRLTERLAGCFTDRRNPDLIEHTVPELLAQRIYGIALGYEDLNDHDALSVDPILAVAVGKADPDGGGRRTARDRGNGRALAGKSTLNRLELTPERTEAEERYKKIAVDMTAAENLLMELCIESYSTPPERVVLDFDATDDPLYGHQEGRFFHGYYDEYCYLPLYVFCDQRLVAAELRTSNIDGSEGTEELLGKIVLKMRETWPETEIIVRGDSGFAREGIMSWCEAKGVFYVFGLARNSRLEAEIVEEMGRAKAEYKETKRAARVFKEFRYQTRESWTRERRVVGKAEYLTKGSNPRFVVTNLTAEQWETRALYEELYCARGEMENRIKEQQMCLFADRTSAETMRANQLRLWFSSFAYVLVETLRRVGLKDTPMAQARCDTIRLRLLKIGAMVKVTVRKIWVNMSSACPLKDLFRLVLDRLRTPSPHLSAFVPMRC